MGRAIVDGLEVVGRCSRLIGPSPVWPRCSVEFSIPMTEFGKSESRLNLGDSSLPFSTDNVDRKVRSITEKLVSGP